MTAPPPDSGRAAMVRRTSLAAVLGLCIVAWIGCGTPQERYRVLSTFFDGVPNPTPTTRDAALAGITNPGAASAAPVLLSTHKPFAEKQCQACHDSPNPGPSASVLNTDTCLRCHESVLNQFPVMHEAVTNKSCLWCHEPHASRHTKLLRTDSASLCTQCHERPLLGDAVPEHKSEEASCFACHAAHGGSDLALLKPRTR